MDLTASTATDSSGKDLDFRVEELEAVNALEWCNTSNEENPDSFSLLEKFVMFGNFLGLPVEGFEKEISSLMRKLESRKGREKKEEIVVGYSFGERALQACLLGQLFSLASLNQGKREGQWGINVSFRLRLFVSWPSGLWGLVFWRFMGNFARLLGFLLVWVVLFSTLWC